MGLHIDNTTGCDPLKEEPSIMRLCINLGREDRHLLFINKTVNQMKMLVTRNGASEEIQDADTLTGAFFRNFPDYPVAKFRQRPYDVYVMPADNIIHDGSTEGTVSPDVTMVFQGDFCRRAAKQEQFIQL